MTRAAPHHRAALSTWIAALLAMLVGGPVRAQVVGRGEESTPEPVDSADVRGRARREQARFERRRNRLLPLARTLARGGDACDEIVGRFCLWFDDSDEKPVPEPADIDSLRLELLAYLDSVQVLLPGDGWVLGQRVWYRAEGGRWTEALRTARECHDVEEWWCAALQGLALHGLGRFAEAERAFDGTLRAMDPKEAAKWREPRRAIRGGVRDAIEKGDGDGEALDRMWMLADPSYLVPGNDRKTEHYARRTVAHIREDARNPYQIGWGGDLDELLIRFGWEVGWERARGRRIGETGVVGHQHPAGREYMPGEESMRHPADASRENFQPGQARPRSLYAPAYAPVILPMEGQVVVFPRGDRELVVATAYVPADTTRHPGDSWPRPWMEAGDQAGLPDRSGLFLVPVTAALEGAMSRTTREGGREGALLLDAPAGDYVVSVEAWRPPARVAGRTRMGLRGDTVPPDVATLSGLLLVEEGPSPPTSVAEAAERALVRATAEPGGSVGVVWEVNGLGWRPTTVGYELSLEAAHRGLFRRLGEGLGLVGRSRPLSLGWEEPGPARPTSMLRHLALDLPDVDPGTYILTLRATITGRGTLEARTRIVMGVPH